MGARIQLPLLFLRGSTGKQLLPKPAAANATNRLDFNGSASQIWPVSHRSLTPALEEKKDHKKALLA